MKLTHCARRCARWIGRWFAFNPDGKVITCHLSRTDGLLFWDVEEHRVALMALPRAYELVDASFSTDGQHLAIAGYRGLAAIWKDPLRVLREQGISLEHR